MRMWWLILCFGLLGGLAGCAPAAAPLAPPEPGVLRVATYNVHYIVLSKETGAWSVADWERRKGPLAEAFRTLDADVIGFQEMESFSHGSDGSTNLTLDWLCAQNPDYRAAAVGDWRVFPSTQPIFYRHDRLEVEDQGWFFFSETPEVIYSRTFDGSYPAFASWARFRERATDAALTVFNIHFDYSSRLNRRESARLVAARAAPLIEAGERVLVIGDVNGGLGSEPVEIMAATGLAFRPVRGATYHWNYGLNLTGPVDHISHAGGFEAVGPPVVLRQRFGGEWPTDHYPVVQDFRIAGPAAIRD